MRRLSTIAVALAMALGAATPGFAQPAPVVTATIPAKRKKGLFNGKVKPSSFAPAGHFPRKDRMNSAAQHKRASGKAANRTKHRRTA